MKVIRWIARFICSTVLVIVGTYTVIAIAITLFIVTGKLTPGDILYLDSTTPTLLETVLFIGGGSIIFAVFAVARHKLASAPEKRA